MIAIFYSGRRLRNALSASATLHGKVLPIPGPRYVPGLPRSSADDILMLLLAGSGIAPFLPVPAEPSGLALPFHAFLFAVRLSLLVPLTLTYLIFVPWLPAPLATLGKKAYLWSVFGFAGLWWIDLQIDGVRRGDLARHPARLPGPGAVIAASFTSPLDVLYLAAIFDPVFTASAPDSPLVQPLSLLRAAGRAFAPPPAAAGKEVAGTTDLPALLRAHPRRPVVVFPECTPTNGRGILPFGPAVATVPPNTPVFPVSLRYTAADVTTPVPRAYITFLWNLLSRPNHVIRVRIARSERNAKAEAEQMDGAGDAKAAPRMPDRVADALARLGRVQRVGLGVKEKRAFVQAWTKHRRWY